MNVSRRGKIARLPKIVRDELNRRLANGEQGKRLADWLNTLPEVQAVVAAEFGGTAIREQNLSEWKQGGHREWLAQQEAVDVARQLAAEVGELQLAGAQPLTDNMAVWLTARYVVAARKLANENGEIDRKLLRELCSDLVALRRGDHSAARLKMEVERLERDREKTEAEVVEHFEHWVQNPMVRDSYCEKCLGPEERARRMREMFGLPPLKTPESNPVKPSQTNV